MTEEYDTSIQELLEWNIIERNRDGELKPTADFLVWYHAYLLHEVTESYGEDWETTAENPDITVKQKEEIKEEDKERADFILDCIENQIVGWTAQLIGKKTYIGTTRPRITEQAKIVYNLINEIERRVMETHNRKTGLAS